MRIRSTKPEFWRSRRIASVDWEARLVLKGLESYVDDNGVGKDDLELIVGDLFSRDLIREPSRTLARVSDAIGSLREAGLVHRYEADGADLLFISWWESIQRIDRPSKGRLRRPDGTLDYGDSEIGSSLASPREDDASPRTRNRGTGEQGNSLSCPSGDEPDGPDSLDRFEEFWDTYGKKVGRKKAEQKYRLALRKITADDLVIAAASYVANQRAKGKHPEFTKDPATWLNGEHWNDEASSNVTAIRSDADGREVLPPLPKGFFDQ